MSRQPDHDSKHGAEAETVDNDHQKTVQGKNQRGPEDKVGRDAGGNQGSKGQNIDSRRKGGTGTESGDLGDERGSQIGSGRGQSSRQHEAVNKGGSTTNQGGRGGTS
jgi:hypothetical protein